MSDRDLVLYGSSTLAGIKTGSLFNAQCGSPDNLYREIRAYNDRLYPYGLRLKALRVHEHTVLLYLYRETFLKQRIADPRVWEILKKNGYEQRDCAGCLDVLNQRIRNNAEFPHEIGLFLGYPVDDVDGFIRHKGKDCRYMGYWKVYGNVEQAKSMFDKYQNCQRIYQDRLARGIPLEKLAVKA